MSPAAARPSARYRSAIVVFILAFVLLGFFALGRLSIDLPPSRDAPRLNIRIYTPGLTAPTSEEKLTLPLEAALAGVPGVATMESVTTSESASIDLRLNHRRDVDAVQRDVMSRLERARVSWPASIDPPSVTLIDDSSAVMEFNLTSGTHDPLALRDWIEAEFAKRLRELPGVATVDIAGGTVREILVMPDQRRLAGYGLSFEDLLQAIRKNPEVDSRVSQIPLKKRIRREPMLSGSLAALAAIPVVLPDGESIRLSEVARLALSQPANPAPARMDGAEVVKVTVHRQVQAALSDVVGRVRSHVDWMRANRLIPDGIEIYPLSGRFDEARQLLRKISCAFLIGFLLVLSAAHLLWGRWRRTLMLGVITVASLQGTFIVMALSGMALDVMTLGGLALGTGLFGGSVMLMFAGTARSVQAPVNSVSPVMAAAVALVAALVPVWFVGGELSALYREFVAVFASAWLLAALLAGWLVPMFDTRRRGGNARWNAAVGHAMVRARHSYDALLRRLLRRAVPGLAVAAVAIAVLGSVLFVKIREAPAQNGPPGQEIVLRIQGLDGAGLLALVNDIAQRLGSLPELRQVSHSAQSFREELMPRMDDERAREVGVDIAGVGKALAIATTGIPAGSFRDSDRRYNVRMRLPPEDSGSVATGKILLLGELENRPAVHLRDVATLERVVVPALIRHRNGKPVIEVTAQIASESSSDQAMKKVNAMLDGMRLSSGYQLFFGRHAEIAPEKRGQIALGISVLLIMIMATLLYRSPRLGLLITLIAGVTLVGTGAVLLTFGVLLSPPVWLGALLLLGISAGHATALVARCEAQSPDLPLLRRLNQAARYQFGPLFAMALTAILGMASLIWIDGSAFILHTLIIVLVTGLLFSLPVNLLLTPLLYWLVSRKEPTSISQRL
ncbi:MAG: efflux RND transporter permease subunit [Gammaproteobacteria bacterium]|nr:efflux RND transporter permease subunit [Gammaproteobacteria bacterium]